MIPYIVIFLTSFGTSFYLVNYTDANAILAILISILAGLGAGWLITAYFVKNNDRIRY